MMLRVSNSDKVCSGYDILILVNRILYVDKENAYPDVTRIHLDTGDILESSDSLNTIEAKLRALKGENNGKI